MEKVSYRQYITTEGDVYSDIKDYEGLYKVSLKGDIYSVKRKKKMHHGGERPYGGRLIKSRRTTVGYDQVMLCKNGKKKYHQVHRLVAKAFISNPKNKPQINHINGVKHNNNFDNLEWVTQSENQNHAIKTGLQPHAKGEQRGKVCKLKQKEVDEIKFFLGFGVKNKDLAEYYKVNPVTISNIKTGATWL